MATIVKVATDAPSERSRVLTLAKAVSRATDGIVQIGTMKKKSKELKTRRTQNMYWGQDDE